MPLFFIPPTQLRAAPPGEELWFVAVPVGLTVVKVGGTWKTVNVPSEDFLATCQVVLRGGFKTPISQALATELTAAGYGANVVTS